MKNRIEHFMVKFRPCSAALGIKNRCYKIHRGRYRSDLTLYGQRQCSSSSNFGSVPRMGHAWSETTLITLCEQAQHITVALLRKRAGCSYRPILEPGRSSHSCGASMIKSLQWLLLLVQEFNMPTNSVA